jgi:predicted metal-binding membrane protein
MVVTWIATAWLMGGMDAGPGTPLGGFGWFVGSWVVMMAAMMLPSELRFALVFAQLAYEGPRPTSSTAVHTWLFLSGYLVSWTGYGVLAYGADWVLRTAAPRVVTWEAYGPVLAGMVIVTAGVYQLSSMKDACLHHCISPASFFVQRWRLGAFGALRMGMEHGLFCIGCCWGLMLVLFMMGVMSLLWMVLLAGVMFAEKVLPWGSHVTRPLAIVLIALGLWVAVAPRTVPFLTQPSAQHLHQP